MNKDEILIRDLFASYKLVAERFSKNEKRSGKTPDFRVFSDGTFRFFCEVKSIEEDLWLTKQINSAPTGNIVESYRNTPVYNRLSSDVHTAVKQLDAVNPNISHPNVLTLVSHEKNCTIIDLIHVLTGNVKATDGSSFPLFQRYAGGRIRDEKMRIHLFIWIDNWSDSIDTKGFLFCDINKNHYLTLCRLFGKDPNSLEQVDS